MGSRRTSGSTTRRAGRRAERAAPRRDEPVRPANDGLGDEKKLVSVGAGGARLAVGGAQRYLLAVPLPAPLHPIARLPEEWSAALAALGERAFAAKQVFGWIHKRGVVDAAAMTNLSATLRAKLAEEGLAPGVCVPEQVHRSADGTRKVAVRLRDGALVETVLLPAVSGVGSYGSGATRGGARAEADAEGDPEGYVDDADEDDDADDGSAGDSSGAVAKTRVTQCISTQVGCAMGCVFCASGVAGLKRHLAPEEIVGQVLLGRSLLDDGEALRGVVYMGMGEPLHNYDATARSLRLITHRDGISLSTRRVTVSTSGLVPEIEALGRDFGGQIALAISLHAADDETRSALMPVNRKYPLRELMAALRAYPLPKRRRITIEYTLVAGRNDDPAEARKLARLLRGLPVKINLIPMNPIDASTLGPPDRARVEAFQEVLTNAGYSCFVRRRRGDDVAAACGQLVLAGAKPKVRGLRPA
jgi:23S rRNA (adenine2503-C2)-methyltransferase